MDNAYFQTAWTCMKIKGAKFKSVNSDIRTIYYEKIQTPA